MDLMMNESAVASHIRLDAAQRNVILLRNNSGGFYDEKGRFVRYGLGSFTKEQKLASSDYVGVTPVFITPQMIGQILGVFTAIETKPSGWKFNNLDERALHQKNFIDMMLRNGAYAGFAQSIEDFRKIIKHG